MQIIDFDRKGNVVRFYLGKNAREALAMIGMMPSSIFM